MPLLGLFAYGIGWVVDFDKKQRSKLMSDEPVFKPSAQGNVKIPVIKINEHSRKEIYSQIANELETDTLDKALWTEAYSLNDGDELKTRTAYIRARAKELENTMGGAA